jgi:hypothetical protein
MISHLFRLSSLLTLLTAFVSPVAGQSLEGVWRTEGYGEVFEIGGSKLKVFEVTTQTCLPADTFKRESSADANREVTFRSSDGDVYFVRAGGAGDHRVMHVEGSASDIRIDRLQQRPAACDEPVANTPAENFEVFTRTWAENYISFDLKHVDWDEIVKRNRAQLTQRTSPAALFDILQAMIEPFGDAHTSISAPKLKREFDGLRPGTDRLLKDLGGTQDFDRFQKTGMHKLLAVIDRAYLHGMVRRFCNDEIQFGNIDASTGYLRILAFSGYSKQRGFANGLSALESALDTIFSDSSLKALVIDVRINFGGDDPYGLSVASRLAASKYLAYTKYARADPVMHDKWAPGDASMVEPGPRPGFRGPVVELTGPLTISAGETFTQALMGRVPHVTRIGENTQGVFSDVLGRHLPNGWLFGLPNEVYRTADGTAFDGPGIPPDIAVPVFAAADVAAGKDPAMAKALEVLRGQL